MNESLESLLSQQQEVENKRLNFRKVLYSLIILHSIFLFLDFLSYQNSQANYSEATMHKIGLVILLFLPFYLVILIYAFRKMTIAGVIVTIICFLVHAFIPTLNDEKKELYGILSNAGIVGLLLLLIAAIALKAN